MPNDPTGGYSASYPADLRAGAGYRIEKVGLSARLVADFRNVPLLTEAPAAGHVLVQRPEDGSFDRLDLANLPTTVPQNGSVSNAKFAAAPALTLKGNATGAMAQPQDVPISALVQPGTPIGDSLGNRLRIDAPQSLNATARETGRNNLALGNVATVDAGAAALQVLNDERADGISIDQAPASATVPRKIADKLFERVSINDFYRISDGDDYLPAFNRAVAALPESGGTIRFPRRATSYPVSGPLAVGNGSAATPSTKQNISIEGEGVGCTGNQFGYGTQKGVIIEYTGTAKIGAIMSFRGPMVMGLKNITLKGGFKEISNSTTISTTAGFNTITNIANTSNIVVGSNIFAPEVIPPGTIVISITGNTAVVSNNATATANGAPITFYHNEAYADRGLELLHVFRSKIEDVGVMDARVGIRQDVYADANIAIGSADTDFTNVWVENQRISGGTAGTAAFDIGNADVGTVHKFDVARCTYTNLVGIVAGDPNATGLVLRYADNLTFRGGMMYSLNPPGLGFALAILTPTGQGTEVIYPAEVTITGVAFIGRFYRDPRWKPSANGGFGFAVWPLHTGDMLNRAIQGHGSLPSFEGFTGVDDRGIFFGLTQFRSWLDDQSSTPVAYDAPATFSRKTALTQVTGTTAQTVFATHKMPAIALRARNTKDFPNGSFPLSDAAQYGYDRVISLKQSGNWFNANTGVNLQFIVRIGGTTVWQSGNINLVASQFYGAWRFEGEISQSGSASQSFNGRLVMAGGGSGQGVASSPVVDLTGDTVTAVDLTGDQPLTVSILPDRASFVWNAERSIVTVY